MDRVNWYYKQNVAAAEMDDADDKIENAIRSAVAENGVPGITNGLTVAGQVSPNLTVALAAGVAYNAAGVRLSVPGGQTVDVSKDYLNATTTVSGVGNSKWVSLFLVADRANSDPRTDGNGDPVLFISNESYRVKIVQGTEAPTPARPALDSSGILLCDVLREYGVSVIDSFVISFERRQMVVNYGYGTTFAVNTGNVRDGLYALLNRYRDFIEGIGDSVAAQAVLYNGGGPWADATGFPSDTVEGALDRIVSSLAATGGAGKIGAVFQAGLGGSSVAAQINALHTRVTTTEARTASLAPVTNQTRVQNTLLVGALQAASALAATSFGALVNTNNLVTSVEIPVSLPQGAVIRGAAYTYKTGNTHAALPANMPKISMYKVNVNTNTGTQIGTLVTDPSANVAAYDAIHPVAMTGLADTVDNSLYSYFVRINVESGANWVVNGLYSNLRVTYDVAASDITS